MEIDYLLHLIESLFFSRNQLRLLKRIFSNWKSVHESMLNSCAFRYGISNEKIYGYQQFNQRISVQECVARYVDRGISYCAYSFSIYPDKLRNIYDYPLLLFYKGTINNIDKAIAVIGTRKNSLYGEELTRKITEYLSSRGIWIVSGLALGIDSIAHETTVNHGGKTIAVLGQSFGVSFGAARSFLVEKIIDVGGGVITEYPLSFKTNKYSFPERNRIIAGLSDAVIITEAGIKSGALITARFALDEGRDVFAVPGRVGDSNYDGTNKLIKQGANIITDINDIFEQLNWGCLDIIAKENSLSGDRKQIYSILSGNKYFELSWLVERSGMDYLDLIRVLSELELEGYLKKIDSTTYELM